MPVAATASLIRATWRPRYNSDSNLITYDYFSSRPYEVRTLKWINCRITIWQKIQRHSAAPVSGRWRHRMTQVLRQSSHGLLPLPPPHSARGAVVTDGNGTTAPVQQIGFGVAHNLMSICRSAGARDTPHFSDVIEFTNASPCGSPARRARARSRAS